MSGFVFRSDAISDLEEIWGFIANDNLSTSDGVLNDIRRAIKSVASYPHMGHVRVDLMPRPKRFILFVDF
jgi:plasmid stabilization system protein ParE